MTTRRPIVVGLMALGIAGNAAAGVVEDRIAELERQLSELKATVEQQQSNIETNAARITFDEEMIEEARPSKPGTKFQYGGFIQLDAITTNYSEGKPGNDLIEDFLVPSLIPVEPASGRSDS